jgi:hypothetical protein
MNMLTDCFKILFISNDLLSRWLGNVQMNQLFPAKRWVSVFFVISFHSCKYKDFQKMVKGIIVSLSEGAECFSE